MDSGELEKLDPFSYLLPAERIAQRPVRPYDQAKLLVIRRDTQRLEDSIFADFASLVTDRDLLVLNETRVIPARLFGELQETGGEIELLLVDELALGKWRCLARPMKKLKPETVLKFGPELSAVVESRTDLPSPTVVVQFSAENQQNLGALIRARGSMPIPPYIRRGVSDSQDQLDYQTSFARVSGSIAAPTAALHFTSGLLENIKAKGCGIRFLTLHVGVASFLPLWEEGDSGPGKRPAAERYTVSPELLQELIEVRSRGGRVIAVGTTVVRALEAAARNQDLQTGEQLTDLFITPGHQFKLVDVLVTNFHQPRTTHLLLVQAFIGRELLERAYQHALENDYRFLSYGDGMVIL